MFRQIMVPIDLAHADQMQAAIDIAIDMSERYDAPICFVGVTSSAPSDLGKTPEEYEAKLAAFGAAQGERRNVKTTTKAIVSHDPTADLDDTLLSASTSLGADLVVMSTHIPNIADAIWPSHGGRIASHSDASVFLVRGG